MQDLKTQIGTIHNIEGIFYIYIIAFRRNTIPKNGKKIKLHFKHLNMI